jgi:hypothetical protein
MGTPAQARKKSDERIRKRKQIVDEREQIIAGREQFVDRFGRPQNRQTVLAALDLYFEREYFAREILPCLSLDPRQFEARLKSA